MTTFETTTAANDMTTSLPLATANAIVDIAVPKRIVATVSYEQDVDADPKKQDALATWSAKSELEQMVADREHWQDTAYKTSNEMLYSILQRCYAYYKKMELETAAGKAARDGLTMYIKSHGVIVTKSAHSMSRIVACVFGNGKRVSAYSIALRSALQRKIAVADLATFLADEGGVEELRLAKSPTALSVTQKAEKATTWANEVELATVSSDQLSQTLDAGKADTQHVLLATQCADGSFKVHAVISNSGVVNAALAAFYSANKKAREAANATAGIVQQKADLSQLIADAAAQTQA